MNILESYARFINSDRYQYTESDVYLSQKMHDIPSVFNYFFRKTEDNGFAVVAGTHSALSLLSIMNTTDKDEKSTFLQSCNISKDLKDYLMTLEFHGDVYAMREGEISFANQPVFTLSDNLIMAKILETPLLNSYNYQMAIASKASRITRAAEKTPVLAFGPRRAHGFDSALMGTKAALIGGCTLHSSLALEYFYGIPSIGSMSHSFVQSFGIGKNAEYKAFKAFANRLLETKSSSIFFLIDTYDTLKSGLINAMKVFSELNINDNFTGVYGIRLDSGDLTYFSKMCREELDRLGFKKAKILLTNSLDEHLIVALKQQHAPFDMIGVGDAIATSKDNPCFGGVYKLVSINNEPAIKLSNDTIKTTTPCHKHVYRIYQHGEARADLVTLADSDPDVEKLLAKEEITITAEFDRFKSTTFKANSYEVRLITQPMIIKGELTALGRKQNQIEKSRAYYRTQLNTFSMEHKRIINPHYYKVALSQSLYEYKYKLIKTLKEDLYS